MNDPRVEMFVLFKIIPLSHQEDDMVQLFGK